MFTTTALFAAILVPVYLYLSVNVIRNRVKHQVALGDGNHQPVKQAIRAHGNFIEYVPFFLILLLLLENLKASNILILVLGGLFVLGRLCHAYSLCFAERYEGGELKSTLKFRQAGMFLTFGSYGVASISLFVQLILMS